MQLADMCIGAITRAERDRENAERWKRMLAPRIALLALQSISLATTPVALLIRLG
jgi:hypothetical protein